MILLRDIGHEFEGTPTDIIDYLNGPLRKEVRTRAGAHAIENGIAAVQRGDLQRANKHLREVSIELHEVQ